MATELNTLPPTSQLWTRGFIGLIVSQFAGAFNDNLLKGILLLLVAVGNEWNGVLGDGGTGWISVMLTVPFILFLGLAGQLADRYSKRTMVLWVRLTELPIVVVIGIGLLLDSPWLTIAGFLALATQSAFFNPPKYGMIREVTGPGQLSRANGVISLATNISIIAGMAVSGQLLEQGRYLVALLLFGITILGVVSAWSIPKLPAMNPGVNIRWNPFSEVVRDLLAMRSTPVWIVSWIWSGFFFAAILLVSAIPDMQHELGVSMSDSSLLLGAAGLGIGIGCAIAGWCSGAAIRNTFVCPGGGALVCVYLLMAILPPSWWLVFVLLMLLGIASGFYLVPLLAMMQRLAPPEERGRWLAASNWLCYVMMSFAGLFYALTASHLGVKGIFLACSGVMLFIVVVLLAIPHALKFDEAEYA